MIFVTVGTQKIKFTRLFKYLENITDEKIIIQSGFNEVKVKDNYEIYKNIPFYDMKKYIDNCDILITHGGPDNIFYALSKKKKVIVVPRMSKYKEHINDHQLYFANYLDKNNYCYVARNEEEFINCLNSNNKRKIFKSNTDRFIKRVEKEIDKLLEDV